jgi:hypothetical protein
VFDRFWHPALIKAGDAHVQLRHLVTGLDLEGLLKMRRGFIELTAPLEG